MEITKSLPLPRDLTGQVSVVDHMPKFSGSYSTVYLGSFNGDQVAIKAIKATGEEDSVKRKVLREITLWAATSHRNIHPFYGVTNDESFGQFGALVSPWCSNGDATRYLRQNGHRMVAAERIDLWKGVIEGVAYLHEHKPIIVHGDLKPGNVLIDDLGVPRICDFGLARVFLEVESTGMTTTTEHTGTTRYLAPELVTGEVTVYPTTASDVYALGCLGLEFIYDQKPYSNRANNIRGQIVRDIKRSVPPAASSPNQGWASQHAWSLIKQLWSQDTRYRPSASDAASLLNHTTRSLPPIAIKRIVLFSAMVNTGMDWANEWTRRKRTLLALSLVSRSFCARATPFLYSDIRIFPIITAAKLSSLANTLNIGIKSRHTSDDMSSGYGYYTRTLVLCVGKDVHTLPADTKRLLDKMTQLQLLVLCTTDYLSVKIPAHHLRTVMFRGTNPLLILDQGMLRALLPFGRLLFNPAGSKHPSMPVMSLIRQAYLLPNLQDIDLKTDRSGVALTQLLHVFKDWMMPRLNSLSCTLCWDQRSVGAAFIHFLQTQGPLLRHLTLNGEVAGHAPPISDILSLCSNLQSLMAISYSYIDLLSFPPHPKLEILDIIHTIWHRGKSGESDLDPFEKFISSWQIRFPNLRVAMFQGPAKNSSVFGKVTGLEARFCTEDLFYTVNDGKRTYKRWEGDWIGAGPMDSIYDSYDIWEGNGEGTENE